MSRTKYLLGCLAMAASVLSSCKKDSTFDITGDPEVRFFTNNVSTGNAPDNSLGFVVVNIPDVASNGLMNLSSTFPATIKFPVFATMPVTQDVTISAELDTSLITAYNNTHKTDNYLPFPTGLLNTDKLAATISKGATTSRDSIAITTDLANLKLMNGSAYMAPIKLTTVSNPAAGRITGTASSRVVYIVATVDQRKIKYLALASEAQGTLATGRSAWSVSLTPTPSVLGSITDGSTTTYSRWTENSGQVDVDMQTINNITGVRLYHGNSATYTPNSIDLYLSKDGLNYDRIGSPLKANLTFASNYNYILFYKAIQARYVRLVLNYSTSTNTQNHRITELDVYTN